MANRNRLQVFGRRDGSTFTLIVEPWATEYLVRHGESCEVVAIHTSVMPTFGVELPGSDLVVHIIEGGSTYEFWREGDLEDEMPIPIPE